VFSTLHTNDAASGVVRLIDMGIEPYLIASTVTGFLSQRLVRVLCQDCRRQERIDLNLLSDDGIDTHLFQGKTVYRPQGCTKCQNTGYRGRMGIFEMIRVDDQVRKMIIEKRDASFIRDQCVSGGMKTMLDDGVEKVILGCTSLDEVLRVIRE
jgi:general secretion pathway protein E